MKMLINIFKELTKINLANLNFKHPIYDIFYLLKNKKTN